LRLYDDLIDRILLPKLGHLSLRQLTTQRIQHASADLLKEGAPPATMRKALILLQGALERAVEWGSSAITRRDTFANRRSPRLEAQFRCRHDR